MQYKGLQGVDRINIKRLEIYAKHGVFAEEKVTPQRFLVSAELYLDLREAGKTDDLTKTIHYGTICHEIKGFLENNTFDLLETIAEKLAEELLIKNPQVQEVWLEIQKPDAPVGLDFDTISIDIERRRHKVYVALGSNMGDREAHLKFAVDELNSSPCCKVQRVSPFINTKPYGYTDQPDFLNGCLELETLRTPIELLDLLQEIENKAGRNRASKEVPRSLEPDFIRWGPRTLDLDILFYDDIVYSDDRLQIPHVETHFRSFVLRPLNDIAPHVRHPIFNKTVAEFYAEMHAQEL